MDSAEIRRELARRAEALRAELIASGALSVGDVARLRDCSESDAAAWIERRRESHELFTVHVGDEAIVPAILLNDDGSLTNVAQIVEVFAPLGLLGWELWAWLVLPTGRLSGDVLIDVLAENPERAMRAVRQYAEELAEALP